MPKKKSKSSSAGLGGIQHDLDALISNLDDPATIEALREKLAGYVASLDEKVQGHSNSSDSRVTPTDAPHVDRSSPRKVPVRAHVLDILDDFGFMAFSREIAQYSKARYGREIPLTRFGSLANDEELAHRTSPRPRPVWLCFGLTHDRGESIKRLLARSDWPLEKRIVAPTTGRVQHLQMTIRLCEFAMQEDSSVNPDLMKYIAADHARDLPGVSFRKGHFDLENWKEIASKLLGELLPKDEEVRRDAAARLGERNEHALLFGSFAVLDGKDAGGERKKAESESV